MSITKLKNETLYERADRFSEKAHSGQCRNDKVTPYIVHPRRVARSLERRGCAEHITSSAVLHDVVEDCGVSINEIGQEFGYGVAAHVALMTRDKETTSYVKYLQTIKGTGAEIIKIADIIDNLGDDPTKKSTIKYSAALKYLIFNDDSKLRELYPEEF